MTRWILRLFGLPVLTVDSIEYEMAGDEENDGEIGGGSAHNFERAEPWVDERYDWSDYEDKHKFGFGGDL